MKRSIIGVLCAVSLVALFAGCDVEEGPVLPLELLDAVAGMDKTDIIHRVYIVSGNGGYRIVYPRKINVIPLDFPGGLAAPEVDYSTRILYIHIDSDDNIVIERRLLTDEHVSGLFMVQDSKGQRRIFSVHQRRTGGGLVDLDDIEDRLLNDPDYWQE